MYSSSKARFYSSPSETTFLSTGYSNWKDASGEKHGGSRTHEQSQVAMNITSQECLGLPNWPDQSMRASALK